MWDVSVCRRRRTAGARSSDSVLAAPLSADRRRRPSASPFVRQIGRLNETSTWPLLSKNATGYVSSFGELTGLRLDRSPKRLELVPYVVGDVTHAAGRGGQQPAEGHRSRSQRRPRLEVRASARADARPARSIRTSARSKRIPPSSTSPRSRRSSPSGGRSSSKARASSASTSTATTASAAGCSTRAASAARRAASRTSRRRIVDSAPTQTTILGAAKLTGRVGAFSVGALNAVTSDEDADHRQRPAAHAADGRAALRSYSVVRAPPRVREPVGARLHHHRHEPQSRRRHAVPAGAGVHRRRRLGLAAGEALRDPGLLGRQQRPRRSRRRSPSCRRATSTASSAPTPTHLELDPTRTSLNGYGAQLALSKIGGQRVRFNSNVSVKSPGFDINDVGFMRRADQRTMSNWMQWRNDKPNKYLRSFRFNLNQWAGWNYDGDLLNSGGNVNAHAVFPNNWATGMGVNVNRDDVRRPRDARRPGRVPQRAAQHLGLPVERRAPTRVGGGINIFRANDGLGMTYRDFSPEVTWRPSSFLYVSGGLSISDQPRSVAVDRRRATATTCSAALDQTRSALTTRVNYTSRRGCRSRSTRSRSSRPATTATSRSSSTAAADAYDDALSSVRLHRQPGLQLPLVPHHQRPALGVPSRLDAVRRLAAGARERRSITATFDFSRDFGGVFDAPATNVFLVKWAYWLNY